MIDFIRRIKQMIKQAIVSALLDDNSAYPRGVASYCGKDTYYTRLSPYGLDSHPPRGGHVLLLSSQAQESTKFGIASDMLNRFKGLKENEVVLYNSDTKSYVFLKENGDVDVDAKGDVNVNAAGDINATAGGDIIAEAGTNVSVTAGTLAKIMAPLIQLIGAVQVQGTLTQSGGGAATFSGDITTSGNVQSGTIILGTHLHSGVTSGGDNTGGPV